MDRESAEPVVREMPGRRAERWARFHRDVAATSTYVYDFVWDVTADAEGPFCTDVDGNVLLDFTSHVAAAPLGYNNPKLVDRLREFDLVDPLKIAGQDFYVGDAGTPDDPAFPGPMHLMDRLREISGGYGLDRVFLSNSGAEAVENAIKACYDHAGGTRAITFEGAFHGRTLGALSLNRSKGVHRRDYPEIAGVTDVPYCVDAGCTPESCGCGFFRSRGSVLGEKLDADAGHLPAEDVAYVILEPIQGEGGYRVPSEAFAEEVQEVCDEHGIPLIADEIQSGLGRTGEWWASDRYPIEPDVIAGAKGLRVGATIGREGLFPDEEGRISSTWGAGDVIASLQGALTIDAIEEHDLRANAVERGAHLRERLTDADPPTVVDVRGAGLMIGVEFDTRQRRDAVVERALERGLLTIGCGRKTLRLLPPLDVTEREIEMGADLLLSAIADAA